MERKPHDGIKATTVALGSPQEGRKHINQYWATNHYPKIVHTTLRCPKVFNPPEMTRLSVFEEDGQLRVLGAQNSGHMPTSTRQVDLCPSCPEIIDDSWTERAACLNSPEDMVTPGAGYHGLVKKYCDNCPVVVDCLQHAEHYSDLFGIYGGVLITKSDRAARIRKRKAELGL